MLSPPALLLQFSSVTQSCPSLCDPMNRSTPGLPVHHQLQEFTQTHVHRVGEAIQPFHPLSSPSPPAPNPSQHQSFPMSQLFTCGGQSTIVCKRSLFSTPSPTLTFTFLIIVTQTGVRQYLMIVLICISHMIIDNECVCIYCWPCVCLLLRNIYSCPLPILYSGYSIPFFEFYEFLTNFAY